ncbi:MAG TPA: radical SAM protein [Rhodanobacteraceae bacterium]|nr:radical SAM protein [Rhodanobacteraceae bacterium]
MTASPHTLLVNPTITSRASARFPLSLLQLSAVLDAAGTSRIIDGNVDRDVVAATLCALEESATDAVGLSVMGGPQLAPAIALSQAIRQRFPGLPIIWGGYFPTLNPAAAMAASYVDYAIRGQALHSLPQLVAALASGDAGPLAGIGGLSWRLRGQVIHNPLGAVPPAPDQLLPYGKLGDPRRYLARTYLGRRTVSHQAASGCRFRCTFCGVAAMFGGATRLPAAEQLQRDLTYLKHELGADSVQYFDNNFFDREQDMLPLLRVMAAFELPWWCFARSDALLKLSGAGWDLVRKSRLRMAYIGAESPDPQLLKSVRKGTRPDQTVEVVKLCQRYGVIPELSFMVAPPENTEEETERTFEFIRQLKRINPRTEVVVYIYTPLPPHSRHPSDHLRHPPPPLLDLHGEPVVFPTTAEEWAQPRWVDYACHADAPWVSEALRRRIRDFVTVLRCRYPTVQDLRSPPWAKRGLSAMAWYRYHQRKYDRPRELELANRLVRLRMPQVSGL